MENWKYYFLSLDIFGKSFNLRINGQDKIKTVHGAVLTVISFILAVDFTIMFGEEVYLRTNPKFIQNHVIYPDYSYYHISNKNFSILVKFPENKDKAPNMWKARMHYYSVNTNITTKQQIVHYDIFIDMKRCNETSHRFDDFYKDLILEHYFCTDVDSGIPNIDPNHKFYFGGGNDALRIEKIAVALYCNSEVCKTG